MLTETSRVEQIKRSAQLRAMIMSTLNVNSPLNRADIYQAVKPTMDTLGYEEGSLDNFLYTMSKSGLISKTEVQGGKAVYTPSGVKVEKAIPSATPKPKKEKSPEITIDIVKSTGRVRVAFNGLVVEIGVIN